MEAPGPKEPDQPEIHLVPMSAENLDVLKAKLARLISDTDQTKIKTHEVNTSVGQIKSYDAALDVITREFISYFNSQDNLRLVLVGKADEMNQKARSLFDLISFSESTSQPPSLPGAFWGQADHASPALILSLSDLPQSPEIPTQLGSALMDLALTFPIIQEYLDLAEGLRAKRHLSEHNLGLILSPPALAPPEFKEELQSILKSPEMSALVWSLSQLSLVALLKHFGLPILDCQSSGRGLLASLFWASQIEADEALNLSIDLALDDDGLINERLSQISAKGPETSFKLNTKPTPILFGPGGLFDSQSSFLDCLKAVSETSSKEANRVSSPVVILVGNSLELNLLDGSQPLLALAECLAHLTALGLALDLTAWPTWPEEPAPPTGYAVPVGGANLFREPPTFKADPISTDRSSELSDEMLISPNSGSNPSSPISLAISEILNNQRQGLSILKNLALNLETQSPTPQTISRLQSMGSVLGASSVLGVNHGANQGVDQMGGCDLADPFFDHRQILPGLSHLYSQKPDQPTGSSKASGGNGKSNGSGLSSPSSSEEVWDLLTQIVSDETGYPVESLDPDMELENDLGLDSIKKVELLSTLAENFPKLSGAGSNLSQSLTLGQLSQICLAEKQTSGPKTSALKEETFSQDAPSWPTVQPVLENSRLLLFEILSQETGYPVESLSLDMQLENDLGLDSIKKVELLSALTEKFPQTNPRSLSEALTLGQILDLLVIPQGASDQKVPEQGPKSSSGPWAGPRPTVFQVVSAETGYPIDSLCPEMNLEEDLGLDSIKKVEILSLLSESFPAVADPALLSQAKTLGDWQEAFEVPISKTMSSEQQFSTLKPFTYVASQGLAGQTQTSEPGGGNGSGLKLPSGKDILDRMLGTSSRDLSGLETNSQDMSGLETNSQDLPSLWQVEPELFAATDYGACLWPPSGLIRLIGSDPLAKCLEKELQTLGYQVERRSWLFDFSQWKDDGQKPRVLFLVWPGPDRDPTLITQALKALENTGHQAESIIGLSFLGGFFGFPRPGGLTGPLGNSISGALVGLLKCAAQEWPQVNVRVLDLPLALYHSPTPNWISAIMETATCQGPVELGLPQINRVYNLTLKPYSPTISSSPLLEPGDTVVVTGGGRGVTAAVLLALAKLYRPRLIILGRTPLPPPEPEWLRVLASQREIMEALFRLSKGEAGPKELEARATLILASRELSSNLTALNDTGAQIEYISGDFTNSAFIEETARRIRTRYGPIKGFIHGAGVLADHPIIGKNPSDFDRVYATKTLLASILLEAFQPEPLRLMVFFSSTTARFGRHGQGDYAAGNEVLNKTAWEMATLHPNCRVLALNWGPWAAGMVNETLAGQFKSQGLGLIDLKEGCETFLKLIRTPAGGPAEVVVLGRGTSLDILSGYQ
jgi:acyl carrier protein/NAD(P)-dependent dehydrogenase (short-subunit alcohol dehydrogenase family)